MAMLGNERTYGAAASIAGELAAVILNAGKEGAAEAASQYLEGLKSSFEEGANQSVLLAREAFGSTGNTLGTITSPLTEQTYDVTENQIVFVADAVYKRLADTFGVELKDATTQDISQAFDIGEIHDAIAAADPAEVQNRINDQVQSDFEAAVAKDAKGPGFFGSILTAIPKIASKFIPGIGFVEAINSLGKGDIFGAASGILSEAAGSGVITDAGGVTIPTIDDDEDEDVEDKDDNKPLSREEWIAKKVSEGWTDNGDGTVSRVNKKNELVTKSRDDSGNTTTQKQPLEDKTTIDLPFGGVLDTTGTTPSVGTQTGLDPHRNDPAQPGDDTSESGDQDDSGEEGSLVVLPDNTGDELEEEEEDGTIVVTPDNTGTSTTGTEDELEEEEEDEPPIVIPEDTTTDTSNSDLFNAAISLLPTSAGIHIDSGEDPELTRAPKTRLNLDRSVDVLRNPSTGRSEVVSRFSRPQPRRPQLNFDQDDIPENNNLNFS